MLTWYIYGLWQVSEVFMGINVIHAYGACWCPVANIRPFFFFKIHHQTQKVAYFFVFNNSNFFWEWSVRSCQKIIYSVLFKLFLPSAVSCGDGRSSFLRAIFCLIQAESSHSLWVSLGKASVAWIKDNVYVRHRKIHGPIHRRE